MALLTHLGRLIKTVGELNIVDISIVYHTQIFYWAFSLFQKPVSAIFIHKTHTHLYAA